MHADITPGSVLFYNSAGDRYIVFFVSNVGVFIDGYHKRSIRYAIFRRDRLIEFTDWIVNPRARRYYKVGSNGFTQDHFSFTEFVPAP